MRTSTLLSAICQLASLATQPALGEQAVLSSLLESEHTRFAVSKYLESAPIRLATLQALQIELDIDADLPKLDRSSRLRALRQVSCSGQVTYKVLDSSGDVRVKREVINRYLAAESEARDTGSIAITPANYEFRLKTTIGPDLQRVQIIRLKPKTKRVGLFKGELWLDAATGMPLREAGQFVKVPSVFLKRIRFVREYQIRNGVSIPLSIESTVETRFMGRVELSVHFHNVKYDGTVDCESQGPAALSGGSHENTE